MFVLNLGLSEIIFYVFLFFEVFKRFKCFSLSDYSTATDVVCGRVT
jgi:hypothetical protein